MKGKFNKIVFIVLCVFLLVGCDKTQTAIMDGKEYVFDKEFKEFYATYKMPNDFRLLETGNQYEDNNNKVFELYDKEANVLYRVSVKKVSLGLSTQPMKDDAKAIEDNKNNTITDAKNETYNNINWAVVKYKTTTDDFGKNTIVDTYYGLYSDAGINMYYKIEFMGTEESSEFEQAFLNSFKMNN